MAEASDETTNLKRTRDTLVVYSNLAAIASTPEEFVFHFGERLTENPTTGIEVVTVYTSVYHAKRIALALISSLKTYEEMFGEVPTEPHVRLTEEGRKRLGVKE